VSCSQAQQLDVLVFCEKLLNRFCQDVNPFLGFESADEREKWRLLSVGNRPVEAYVFHLPSRHDIERVFFAVLFS